MSCFVSLPVGGRLSRIYSHVSVLQLRDRVEEVGDTPQEVAESYDLDVAVIRPDDIVPP